MKILPITSLLCLFMISIVMAQTQPKDGVVFFNGTFSELLETAKKQAKPIFIDVYTDWCPPCKKMDKEIFPLKEVGSKYNTNFINYRLDAEKGEGVKTAERYGVKAYPTYLYLDNQGNLLHRALDYMPAASFISHAEKAISLWSSKDNLAQLKTEFETGNRRPEFLRAYIKKMKNLGLDNSEIFNSYFKITSVSELSTLTELIFTAEHINSINSAAFVFLMKHYHTLEKKQKKNLADRLYTQVLYTAFGTCWKESRPLELKQVMGYIDMLEEDISNKHLASIQRHRVLYATMVKDDVLLKKTANLMLSNIMDIPLDSIRAEDVKKYNEVMKPYWSGQLDSTKIEGFQQEKKFAVNQYSRKISSTLHDLASAYLTTLDPGDPGLKDALLWIERAKTLMPSNPTILDLHARLKKMTTR